MIWNKRPSKWPGSERLVKSKLTVQLDTSLFGAARGEDTSASFQGGIRQPKGMSLCPQLLKQDSGKWVLLETHGQKVQSSATPKPLQGKSPDRRREIPEELLDQRVEQVRTIGKSLTPVVPSLVILNEKTGRAWERPVRFSRSISLDTAVRLRLLESVSAISCSETLDLVLERGLDALGVPGALDVDVELARFLSGARDSEDV